MLEEVMEETVKNDSNDTDGHAKQKVNAPSAVRLEPIMEELYADIDALEMIDPHRSRAVEQQFIEEIKAIIAQARDKLRKGEETKIPVETTVVVVDGKQGSGEMRQEVSKETQTRDDSVSVKMDKVEESECAHVEKKRKMNYEEWEAPPVENGEWLEAEGFGALRRSLEVGVPEDVEEAAFVEWDEEEEARRLEFERRGNRLCEQCGSDPCCLDNYSRGKDGKERRLGHDMISLGEGMKDRDGMSNLEVRHKLEIFAKSFMKNLVDDRFKDKLPKCVEEEIKKSYPERGVNVKNTFKQGYMYFLD